MRKKTFPVHIKIQNIFVLLKSSWIKEIILKNKYNFNLICAIYFSFTSSQFLIQLWQKYINFSDLRPNRNCRQVWPYQHLYLLYSTGYEYFRAVKSFFQNSVWKEYFEKSCGFLYVEISTFLFTVSTELSSYKQC